jgi:5-(carboxyamino)imidazole ribonucleotide synthase
MSDGKSSDGFPVVGIVGGGQLARMMVQAAVPLGIEVRILAEHPDDGAARVASHVDIGSPTDPDALRAFAAKCDIITLDHELVHVETLQEIEASGTPVRPGPRALLFAKDKLHQRTEFAAAGLPVPVFEGAGGSGVIAFAARHDWPVIAKAQRGGYDGRGVWVVPGLPDSAKVQREAQKRGLTLMLEEFVHIKRELAVIVARRPSGEAVTYPIVETVQRDGICHEVIAPAEVPAEVAEQARELGLRIAELTGAVGIIATELFWTEDGRILINEVATRPHNSGHFTIDGCVTSQFENHLRAVLDWPLGPTDLTAPSVVMINLLGTDEESLAPRVASTLAADAGVRPYLYGKQSRPGRKIGHVNVLGDDAGETRERAQRAALMLTGGTNG